MVTPAASANVNSTETTTQAKTTQQPPVAAKPEQAPDTPTASTASTKVTPITDVKPSPAPAKTPDPTPAVVNPSTAPAPDPVVLSRDQRIMQELELRFIQIKELGDTSYFSHEGVCRKCGWHTMEHSGESAASLMSAHVVRHWKDVAPQIK